MRTVLKLIIGNKAYSSWSMRPWLALKQAGIPFEEERISFNDAQWKPRVLALRTAGMVPVLLDGDLAVWDTLAIAEYLAERYPGKHLWPEDVRARAVARSGCAEMHSGFQLLRASLPMNFTAEFPGLGWSLKVQDQIDRLVTIWQDARQRFGAGGPFMFGQFSHADAFFAPVVRRFIGHAVKLPPVAEAYVQTISELPAYKEWESGARVENDFYAPDEPYRRNPSKQQES